MGRFVVTEHEEYWNRADEFDERAEAVAWAREEYPGKTVWTGVAKPVDVACLDGEVVLSLLAEHAQDQAGEAAADWPAWDSVEAAALGRLLNATLRAWLEGRGKMPTFFSVAEVEEHPPVEE